MKRTTLTHAASFVSPPVLAQPDRSSDRLLAWASRTGEEPGGAALIDAYTAEGWNVLQAECGAADSDSTAADIADAVRQCAGSARIVFAAEPDLALAISKAALVFCASNSTAAVGLVTTDALADEALPPIADRMAKLDRLATVWAVRRGNGEVRRKTLALHGKLQGLDRETHFVVLPEPTRPLVQHLADAQDPLGRETRWLLDPVHSRSP